MAKRADVNELAKRIADIAAGDVTPPKKKRTAKRAKAHAAKKTRTRKPK